MLYVDEDNVPAIRMYEALGFTRATVDAMYRRHVRQEEPAGHPRAHQRSEERGQPEEERFTRNATARSQGSRVRGSHS